MPEASEAVEFVFSIRSPYAYVAARHVLPMVHPETPIRWCPFFPLPEFANFLRTLVPAKVRYNIEDLTRLAKRYGLRFGSPPIEDPDWSIPHAAFLWADRQGDGAGAALGRALLDARWESGEDVTDEDVLRATAHGVGLDGDAVAAASRDEALRAEVTALVKRNYDERGLFGVPMFVLADGQRFWGHDRMMWAIRDGYVRGAE